MNFNINLKDKRLWIVSLVVILILVRFFTHSKTINNMAAIDESKPASVLVQKVPLENRDSIIELSGHIESEHSIKLVPQTDGIVKLVSVQQGMKVREGDIILVLDEKDKLVEFNRASQLLKQKTMDLEISNKLFKSDDVSIVENTRAKTAFDEALSQFQRAKNNLDFTKVRSPINGYLDKLNARKGDYVNPVAMPGGVANILSDEDFIVVFSAPQTKIHQLAVGQKGSTNIDKKKIGGTVEFISNIAEIGTRTYYGELRLETSENNFLLKMIGAPVQVRIAFDKSNAVKLKDSAMYIDDDGSLNIKVITNNKVEAIPVTILESENDGTTWFGSQKFGDRKELDVIVRGAGFLSNGDDVKNIEYIK